MAIFGFQGYQNLRNGNYLGASKNSLDIGVSFWSLLLPRVTGPAGLVYFGIDTFYPGGWPAAMEMNNNLTRQNQQFIPNFNLFKDF